MGFPALGFLPSLMALTLYSMLPILRNGVAGIRGVDPAAVEAAQGMGMTGLQRLFWVELPLAAPVIMAGARTAAVWTIGAATLATPVGQTSLGNYIFLGPADGELGLRPLRLRRLGRPGPGRRPAAGPDRVGPGRRDRACGSGPGALGLTPGAAAALSPLAAAPRRARAIGSGPRTSPSNTSSPS